MDKKYYKILRSTTGLTHNVPVYLNCGAYEMGGMVGFEGDIEQVEQITNFNYEHTGGNTIRLYNTVNRDVLKIIKNETFTIDWGDGSTDTIGVGMGTNLEFVDHTFSSANTFEVTITLNNNWTKRKLSKKITVPKDITINNLFSNYSQYGCDIKFIKTDLNKDRICLNTIIFEKYLLSRVYSDYKTEYPDKDISDINIPILTSKYNLFREYSYKNEQQKKIFSSKLLPFNIKTYGDIQRKLNQLNKIQNYIMIYINVKKHMLSNYLIYNLVLKRKLRFLINHKKIYSKIVRTIKDNDNKLPINNYNQIDLGFNTNFNTILSCDNRKKNHITVPELFTAKNMIHNYLTHTVFTEKIDGITKRNIILKNCYPPFPEPSYFSTEYLENQKMHFIISITNNKYKNKSFVSYMDYLRSTHEFTKHNVINSSIEISNVGIDTFIKEFKNFKSKEIENYNSYIEKQKTNNYKGKIFWWPKKFFEIKCSNIESYILFTNYTLKNDLLHIFKNDGWIFQHKDYSYDKDLISERTHSFKLKPVELLTIDLQYKNYEWFMENDEKFNITEISDIPTNSKLMDGCIYRCYPILDNNLLPETSKQIKYFEPREKRFDKKTPNPKNIVLNIINEINNPIEGKKIVYFITNRKVYYNNNKKDTECNTQLKYKLSDYKKCYQNLKGTVFDIGGGYSTKKHLQSANIDEYYFGDIDISCLINTKVKSTYLDFNKQIKQYTPLENVFCNLELLTTKYDSLMMINCINFGIHGINLSTHLSNLSKKGTKLLIRFMDADLFEQYIHTTQENIIIKCPYNSSFINYNHKKKINKIYYSWVHTKPIDEQLVGISYLISQLEYLGWKLVCYEKHPKFDENNINTKNLWDLYFICFSCAVFERLY